MNLRSNFVCFSVTMIFVTAACGTNSANSEINNKHSTISHSTPDNTTKFREQFKECLISEYHSRPAQAFNLIKTECFTLGQRECNRVPQCELSYETAVSDLRKKATGVDCDSGYCTIQF